MKICLPFNLHLNTETPTHIPRQHISTVCFIVTKPGRLKYGTDYKILAPKKSNLYSVFFISREMVHEISKRPECTHSTTVAFGVCVEFHITNINDEIRFHLILLLHSDHTDWVVNIP